MLHGWPCALVIIMAVLMSWHLDKPGLYSSLSIQVSTASARGPDPGRAPTQEAPAAIYGRLLRDLSSCTLGMGGIDPTCTSWKTLMAWRAQHAESLAHLGLELGSLAEEGLRHASAAVRWHSLTLLKALELSPHLRLNSILARAAKEKNPTILSTMLRMVSRSMHRIDGVTDFVLAGSRHPDERVRMDAARILLSHGGRDRRTMARLFAMLNKDSSLSVRSSICQAMGTLRTKRVLDHLEKYTAQVADPLFGPCLVGMVATWSTPQENALLSRVGYELTLKRLDTALATPQRIPLSAISALAWAGRVPPARRMPWIQRTDVVSILLKVVANRTAHWRVRSAAVEVAQAYDCPARLFDRVARGYDGAVGHDARILRRLKRAITRLD